MINNFVKSADYLVSNEISYKTETFTADNVIDSNSHKLEEFFKTTEEMIEFIENKILNLFNVGLISYTGIYYYVN